MFFNNDSVWLSEWVSDKVTYGAVCGQLNVHKYVHGESDETYDSGESGDIGQSGESGDPCEFGDLGEPGDSCDHCKCRIWYPLTPCFWKI